MGRPRGARNRQPMTKENRDKLRANARRPRGRRPDRPERELLDEFKADARRILCGPGRVRLFKILAGELASDETFLRAFFDLANRIGLPVLSQQQVTGAVWTIQVGDKPFAPGDLGWP